MSRASIRKGKQEDISAISDLLVQTWQATYKHIYNADQIADIISRWHNAETLQKQLNDPDLLFLIAQEDETIKGHLLARYGSDKTILLKRLYILPDAQGKGTGKMLYEQMLRAFPDAKSVQLEVEAQNIKALQFYQALGFVNIGRTDNCGGDSNIPALIMERLFNHD